MTAWFSPDDALSAWLSPDVSPALAGQVDAASGQEIELCYHCHKCTAGCPAVEDMTLGPDRILRLVQLGERKRLLESADIWLCAGCETCATRCPNAIDIARVMDALRQMAVAEAGRMGDPDAVKFHRLFLLVVRGFGRMHEAALLAAYKVWSRHLMADLDSGVELLAKGKIPVLPKRIKGVAQVRRAFKEPEEPTRSEGRRRP